jgi:hypothetical protein
VCGQLCQRRDLDGLIEVGDDVVFEPLEHRRSARAPCRS